MKLEEVNNKISALEAEISELKETKRSLEEEKALGSFEENKFYRLHYSCESIYFKYTKDNLYVLDMEGTVGYTGNNCVFIKEGIKTFITRATYETGIFSSLYIPLPKFGQYAIEEIDKDDFVTEYENIQTDVQTKLDNL